MAPTLPAQRLLPDGEERGKVCLVCGHFLYASEPVAWLTGYGKIHDDCVTPPE